MKTAFIYSEKFGSFHYGPDHPMRPVRLKLAYELMEELKLTKLPDSGIVPARQATDSELELFHTREYVRVLKEANTGIIPVEGSVHGLGFGDNPVFNGVYEWSAWSAGASIQAAELVASGKAKTAFNIAGGLHHAMPNRASGFCYINDAAVAVQYLLKLGKRVAYIDIDAHHGDGVEYAFYDTDRVLTVSLHESGQWLFPGTGFVTDIGVGAGKGYSVNVPLPPSTQDGLYLKAFNAIVPPFIEAFAPDVIVTQLGVDSFETDPLTHLSLTTNSFEKMVSVFRSFDIPWVALGGGGYDLSNVARGWTLAWAIMNNIEPPVNIPEEFLRKNNDIFRSKALRDLPLALFPMRDEELKQVDDDIAFLINEVLPFVKAGKG
ncbi:MAG: acetoin utilization protein AcuC [Deltaproteobacteria bacterium]|nr:acetoin utilization protein AcuC [Deltaproteobacteria bacterium]